MVIAIFMVFFFYLVFYNNGFAMDPVNFDKADGMKTPAHIYPEWYFLWSYEVLRGFFFEIGGVSGKDLGLMAFGFAQGIFLVLPWLDRSPMVKPANQRPVFKYWFWLLMADLFVLTIFGKLPPTGINAYVGFFASTTFLGLFISLPFLTTIESKIVGGK